MSGHYHFHWCQYSKAKLLHGAAPQVLQKDNGDRLDEGLDVIREHQTDKILNGSSISGGRPCHCRFSSPGSAHHHVKIFSSSKLKEIRTILPVFYSAQVIDARPHTLKQARMHVYIDMYGHHTYEDTD